jgi:hypothetical protein
MLAPTHAAAGSMRHRAIGRQKSSRSPKGRPRAAPARRVRFDEPSQQQQPALVVSGTAACSRRSSCSSCCSDGNGVTDPGGAQQAVTAGCTDQQPASEAGIAAAGSHVAPDSGQCQSKQQEAKVTGSCSEGGTAVSLAESAGAAPLAQQRVAENLGRPAASSHHLGTAVLGPQPPAFNGLVEAAASGGNSLAGGYSLLARTWDSSSTRTHAFSVHHPFN